MKLIRYRITFPSFPERPAEYQWAQDENEARKMWHDRNGGHVWIIAEEAP